MKLTKNVIGIRLKAPIQEILIALYPNLSWGSAITQAITDLNLIKQKENKS
ncbi:MAG: hypothetical protein GY820_38660 [Gammaproteobacteria bacterium]|nr:hypothetical protein [Gammaproteobacteria bacterium]